jgi:hypothetical protein
MINLKGLGRKWQLSNGGTIQAFSWKDWGRSRITSGRIVGVRAEVLIEPLPNTSVEP